MRRRLIGRNTEPLDPYLNEVLYYGGFGSWISGNDPLSVNWNDSLTREFSNPYNLNISSTVQTYGTTQVYFSTNPSVTRLPQSDRLILYIAMIESHIPTNEKIWIDWWGERNFTGRSMSYKLCVKYLDTGTVTTIATRTMSSSAQSFAHQKNTVTTIPNRRGILYFETTITSGTRFFTPDTWVSAGYETRIGVTRWDTVFAGGGIGNYLHVQPSDFIY